MKKSNKIIIASVLGVTAVVVGTLVFANFLDDNAKPVTVIKEPVATQASPEESKSTIVAANSTEEQLLYLIEEEKLAHDVYTVLYQKYGAKVFGNILQSESTHQSQVLTLLQTRNIKDPRSSELGVFNNTDLQELYDALIVQGNKSATEAYKAGVAIEEKDIADISTQLATTTEQDVITTLESLRSGSENHLRAFNRQL